MYINHYLHKIRKYKHKNLQNSIQNQDIILRVLCIKRIEINIEKCNAAMNGIIFLNAKLKTIHQLKLSFL